MKKVVAVVLMALAVICSGCSSNPDRHKEKGTIVYDLPAGHKLVNVTMYGAGSAVTCISRPRRQDEPIEEYNVSTYRDFDTDTCIVREH